MHPQSVAIPTQQLDSVPTLVQKHEQAALENILTKVIADDGHEPIVGLAEVNGVATEEDVGPGIEA